MYLNNSAVLEELDFLPGFTIPVIILLAVEIILGIASSCAVLLIYWNKRHIRSVATKFIANLALIDLVICCVCIPFTVALLAVFPRNSAILCCCHEAVTSALRNASIITLLLICYDRYKSVTNPFVLRLSHRKAKRALFLVWSITFASLAIPFAEWNRASSLHSRISACITLFSREQKSFYFRLYYLPLFILACMILLPAYLRISEAAFSRVHIQAILMAKTSLVVPASTAAQRWNASAIRQKEWKIAKMTGAVVCSICGLWLPYTTLTFAMYFLKPSNHLARLEFAFLTFGYFNCVLNPLLYAFTKEKFRTAFLRTLPFKKKITFENARSF